MADEKNPHGLSRYIPVDVRREVRKRCGFGCARCGATIYEYEHFYPDFVDAHSHEAKSIVLLCPSCHGLVTKGVIPKEQVKEFSESPIALQKGFSKQSLPVFRGIPSLRLGGGALVHDTPIPVEVGGQPLIGFFSPTDGSDVTQLSANLSDATGKSFLSIEENEWIVKNGDWDFEWVGQRYIFRTAKGDIMLQLRMEPPTLISVEILRTSVNGIAVEAGEDFLRVGGHQFSNCVMSSCRVGLSIG